jgi:hypothetical protein
MFRAIPIQMSITIYALEISCLFTSYFTETPLVMVLHSAALHCTTLHSTPVDCAALQWTELKTEKHFTISAAYYLSQAHNLLGRL